MASLALLGKAMGAGAKWKAEFFEISDTIVVGAGSTVAGGLSELNKCQ